MKKIKFLSDLAVFVAVYTAIVPSNVHAYLDPGTGSYVIQIVMGVALGAAFVLKSSWRTIKGSIVKLFKK